MATLSKSGMQDGVTIYVAHVTQSIDAFTGIVPYDINLSGSFSITGSTNISGSLNSGRLNIVTGLDARAGGTNNTASGNYSHAEGYGTKAVGIGSHSEGTGYDTDESTFISSTAQGKYSHVEGINTSASGDYSHAEGKTTSAKGTGSHAEGNLAVASGSYSHAEGSSTLASGEYSHAGGTGTTAYGDFQTVYGRFNLVGTLNSTSSLFLIGNGNSTGVKANAFEVYRITNTTGSTIILPQVSMSLTASDDAGAAALGVPLGGLYHTSGTLKIRLA